MKFSDISPELRAEIQNEYDRGRPVREMSRLFGIGAYFIYRIVQPDRIRVKSVRARIPYVRPTRGNPPPRVEAERNRAYDFVPTLSHIQFGDPPPMRSALYAKQNT